MAYYYTCLGDNNILHTLNASWVPPIDIILFNAHHEPGWWVLFFNPLILLVSQPSLRSHLHHLPYWFYPQDTTWTIYLALYRVNLLVQGTLLPHLASCSNSSLFYSGTRPICVVARITFLKCILIHIASPCKILWNFTHHTCGNWPTTPWLFWFHLLLQPHLLLSYACSCHSRLLEVFLF